MGTTSGHTARGVALFVFGVFLIACMDSTIKYLAERYPAPVVVAMRYIVHCVLMMVLLGPSQGRKLVETRRTGLVLVRAACLVVASLCMALALQRMPVAEASAIMFLYPMLVVVMAGPVLQEHVGGLGWLAVFAGFIGVLLIARPGGGLDGIGVLFALGSAVCNAAYQLLSRVLAGTESTIALLFHTALLGAVCFGVALPWSWSGGIPPGPHVALFCLTGLLAGAGHFLFTAAHRDSPASALAPLQYAQLIWASLLGWLVFGHLPDGLGILGMAVIALAGAAVALKPRILGGVR